MTFDLRVEDLPQLGRTAEPFHSSGKCKTMVFVVAICNHTINITHTAPCHRHADVFVLDYDAIKPTTATTVCGTAAPSTVTGCCAVASRAQPLAHPCVQPSFLLCCRIWE